MSEIWNNFEHRVWSSFVEADLIESQNFILLVSGGLDSMVMLHLMTRLRPQSNLTVIHVHHGPVDDSSQGEFRNKSVELVKSVCDSYIQKGFKIDLRLFESSEKLSSEDQMRQYRLQCLQTILKQKACPVLTAHHLDDRLETILLKLLRGSSLDGISKFKSWDGKYLRPLLEFNKTELLEYAQNWNIFWSEDPSNQQNEYLRNWIRNDWLVKLDLKDASLKSNLAKSLIRIINQAIEKDEFLDEYLKNVSEKFINKAWLLSLSQNEKQRCLAMFLRNNNILQFTSGQIDEILKRIENNKKEQTFVILKRKWVINALQIMLE